MESDDEASVDFDGENSESDYDENEKLLLEKTRKELAQGLDDSDEESEVIHFMCYLCSICIFSSYAFILTNN